MAKQHNYDKRFVVQTIRMAGILVQLALLGEREFDLFRGEYETIERIYLARRTALQNAFDGIGPYGLSKAAKDLYIAMLYDLDS